MKARGDADTHDKYNNFIRPPKGEEKAYRSESKTRGFFARFVLYYYIITNVIKRQ